MEQYILKSALVAEIDRIEKEECPIDSYEGRCKLFWFERFRYFLDTLEVKEVDLEGEFNKYIHDITAQDIKEEPFNQLEKCAKHFFELGMTITNKAQKEE